MTFFFNKTPLICGYNLFCLLFVRLFSNYFTTNFLIKYILYVIISFCFCSEETSIYTTSDSDSDNNENNDSHIFPVRIINSMDYYRSLLPELMLNVHHEGNSGVNNDRPVIFKKNNASHLGRRKMNRAQNGIYIHIYNIILTVCIVKH